jgi:hypothetical protein
VIFADEARFGRMNRLRPYWAPTGTRPEVAAQLIRERSLNAGRTVPPPAAAGAAIALFLARLTHCCVAARDPDSRAM